MQLQDLSTFLTVAAERSFSAAAKKLHRTQPAVSQAIRRLEEELGERLFDRSSRNGTLTEAGRLLQDYAARLMRVASDAQSAVRELQQVRRGRVVIGANEAAVHSLLPLLERFSRRTRRSMVDVRRVPSRQIGDRSAQRSLDFGVLTFQPAEQRPAVDPAVARRAGAAGPSQSSARGAAARHARGGRAAGRDRAQRPVAGARARAAAVRAAARADQHSGGVAEPRRDQARGGDGDGRRAFCRDAAR